LGNGVKQWLKRITPAKHQLSDHKHLKIFGDLLHDPNLWHLNRRSVSGAFAVGMFAMYLPPFGQMIVAAAIAIFMRVNLPISVALVWVTNPVTIPPMYYFSYLVGSWILNRPIGAFEVDLWIKWQNWLEIIAPLTVGGLVCGAVCSVTGYLLVQGLWRWNLVQQIRKRKMRLRKYQQTSPTAAVRDQDQEP
jgi:uncharacterized protein (DUF2062 family)